MYCVHVYERDLNYLIAVHMVRVITYTPRTPWELGLELSSLEDEWRKRQAATVIKSICHALDPKVSDIARQSFMNTYVVHHDLQAG